LSELTEQAAAAGLVVDVAVEGRRGPLPPGVDLAAFRIVQEALTNVVRHSGSRTARVRLRYDARCVEVRVDDDGPAAAGGDGGGGNGLVGMRERAAALGGAVEAGPRADGGFAVRATLPFARPEPAPEGPGPAPEGPGPEPEPVRAEPSPQPWQEPEPGRPEPDDTEERR
jgi:signal transduction histidine kinase